MGENEVEGPQFVIPVSHWLMILTVKRNIETLPSGRVPVNVTSTVCFLVGVAHVYVSVGKSNDISGVNIGVGYVIEYEFVYEKVRPVQTNVLKSATVLLVRPLFKIKS